LIGGWWSGRPSNAGQKLLKARRGSGGHNMSFKRSFKLKRPEDGGGSQFSRYYYYNALIAMSQ